MKDSPTPNTQSLGRIMMILAWILFLGLLVFFFSVWDTQNNHPPSISVITKEGVSETILTQNEHNQYITEGAINGHKVTLLLDTGANHVVIPQGLAKQLGLKEGLQSKALTAGGNVVVYLTKIDTLSIGHIELHNITALINPTLSGNKVLLGMSALKRLRFTQDENRLILTLPSPKPPR